MSLPKRKPRRNNESNRREELLRVSAKLFREKGFDGTTIRDISGAAGMHSGSPFYHFKTKQDILVAVMEQGLAEGLRKSEDVMASVCQALGISLSTTFTSTSGRPMKIANSGKVIKELFA